MAGTAARAHLSLDEWAALDEDVEGELVDGALEEEEMPDLVHETIVGFIISLLRSALTRRRGIVAGSELKLAVTARRGRKADVVAYLPGAPRPSARDKLIKVPPSIVVEVITATSRDTRRDRVEKAAEYVAFGVRYYWLVDPAARTVEIFERARNKRWSRIVAESAGKVAVPGCAGLVLDLDEMWSEIDALD